MNRVAGTVYLLLGGNQGDVQQSLIQAQTIIAERIGPVTAVSSLYQTAAWGVSDQPDFLNQVLVVKTIYSPMDVLIKCLEIEKALGRERRERWRERLIDIDLLFYDQLVLQDDDLTIPHPRLHLRNFTLIPLLEIAPNFIHPVFEKTIETLYCESKDSLEVILLENDA